MGSEENVKDYAQLRVIFYRILVSSTLVGLMSIILILYWIFNFGGQFDWNTPVGKNNVHIILMLIFMVFIHANTSTIFRICPAMPKEIITYIHAGAHCMVCVGATIGLYAVIQSHNLRKSAHFYSLHSWIGITSISLYYIQFFGGFFGFLIPPISARVRHLLLPVHRFVGQSLFTLCIASTVSGVILKAIGSLGTLYLTLPPPAIILNVTGLLVICFSIAIGNLMTDFRFRRRQGVHDNRTTVCSKINAYR